MIRTDRTHHRHFFTFLTYRREILVCLFLLIATFAVYWQVHQYNFVSFDDNEYVYENPHVIGGLTKENIAWAFTAFHSSNWHPLTWISHMLDCQLFGLNPGRHHLINLLFHIVNTLLLFLVLRQMTGSIWKSGFVAALFALHPMHVESVAWIAERKDVLSAFFFMLTLLAYAQYARQPAIWRYLLIMLLFMLGLMSKPMVVTLPCVLLLADYWPLNRFQSQTMSLIKKGTPALRLFLEKLPLFVLVPISCFLTYCAQKQGGIVKSFDVFPLKNRIANALLSYVSYLGKMVYPSKMAFLYPHPYAFPWWKVAGACLILAAISFLAVKNIKKRPYIIVGWLWYLGTLVPVIGLVQVGMQAMADRYTYIPSIGLFIIVAWGVPELAARWRHKKIWLVAAATVIILIFSGITWKQTGYWKNSTKMLEHTVKVTHNNYVAHDTLGVVIFRQGRINEAIAHYLQALRIYPNNPYTHFNLGVALFQQGHIEDAIKQYMQALRIEPNYFKARTNLGAALYVQGKTQEAVKQYLEALRINPDYMDAHYNLAIALDQLGRIKEAVQHYLKVLRINPNFAQAHFKVGLDLYKLGKSNQALDHFLQALRTNPTSAEAHFYAGLTLYSLGRAKEAIDHYLQILRINPNVAEVYNNLGAAYLRTGNIDQAIACFQKALKIKPDYTSAGNNLKKALMFKQQQ